MSKLAKIFFFFAFLLFYSHQVLAQVEYNTEKNRDVKQIKATGFMDYPPFGYIPDTYYPDSYQSIFKPIIDEYAKNVNFLVDYSVNLPYPTLVRNVRGGNIDIIMGIYHDTQIYDGLEYIFPALLNNPIVVVMLPNRINEVKSTDDLKKLKGAMNSHEHLSDFVANQLNNFNIVKIDNSYDLYKKLYNKDVDYVLASEYNARIELAQLGLRNNLSFSKSPLWNIPLFLGVSKASVYRNQIKNGLQKIANDPKTREIIKKNLADYISQVEQRSVGIVAPDFSK